MHAHIMLIIVDSTNIFTENTLLIYILASQKCKECLEKNLRKCDCLVLFQLVIVDLSRSPRDAGKINSSVDFYSRLEECRKQV